jgi:hypothetical protein
MRITKKQMNLLIVVVGNELEKKYQENMLILANMLKDHTINWGAISSQDDFNNFDKIDFKYKLVTKKKQVSKLCEFFSSTVTDYDFYIKTRPDVQLLEFPDFKYILPGCINARAREYRGPKRITWGSSINGEGIWKNIFDCTFSESETHIVLDDQFFIFDNTVKMRVFSKPIVENDIETEWFHDEMYTLNEIEKNIIGINLCLQKYNVFSGHLNL